MNIIPLLQQLRSQYSELIILYNQIHNTYISQQTAFQQDDEEQVQAIVDQRAKLMEQADKISKQSTDTRKEICDVLGIDMFDLAYIKTINYLLTEELETQIQEIKAKLQQAINLDIELTAQMQKALGENRQKRTGLQQGKKVYQAYNQAASSAMFLDKQK